MQNGISEFYPPSPANVPADLTKPTPRYRLQAGLVMASLSLFVLVYLALLVFFGGLCIGSIANLANMKSFDEYPAGQAAMMIMLSCFLGLGSLLITLYLIKGLFRFQRGGDDQHVEISETEHPRLVAFIRQICADTGAPAPAKIVISSEVNAGVYYLCTFWSLFFPIKKNLHIGLGLVNCLNLGEFKAVLAHEFGHFSQKSMRLGTYVYTANRIIHQIIYGRDWFDDSLTFLKPVLGTIRFVLGGLFKVINFAHLSMTRQMEFQADLVAVSVSGSDAIVHGLMRSDFGQQCLDQTGRDLTAASDHHLYTRDLFFHQTKSAEYLRIKADDPKLGTPPELAAEGEKPAQVFPPNETVLPPMWASHPPHYERELNCKRTYIRATPDERSAWVLFDEPEKLREKLTRLGYERARPGVAFEAKNAEEVQRFIDNERAETIYGARYHGMYADAVIAPGELDRLSRLIPPKYEQPGKLLREHASIFSDELRQRLEDYRQRRKDAERLARFAHKVEFPKGGRFLYREKEYGTAEAGRLLEELETEIRADHEHLGDLDRRIYLVYMGMAGQIDGKLSIELEQRYRFHLQVQEMTGTLRHWNREVQGAFNAIAGKRDPDPAALHAIGMALRGAQDALAMQMNAAITLRLPPFKNMQAGLPLTHFLDAKPVIHDLFGTQQIMDGSWINQILARHGEIIDKLTRIQFKSMGSLLEFQERLGDQWKARYSNVTEGPLSIRDLAKARTAPPPNQTAEPAPAAVLQSTFANEKWRR